MNNELRNTIKTLTRTYYDYQDERLSLDGRLEIKKDGTAKKDAREADPALLIVMKKRRDDVYSMEKELEKEIATEIHKHPLWKNFLSQVKGVGEVMAAVIISEFDIYKAPHASNLWSFAGLAPGKDKMIKGKKTTYNKFLRAKLNGVLGGSFLRSSSPYREFYDNKKHQLEHSEKKIKERIKGGSEKEVMWKNASDGHRHNAAIRYMIKMFLKDLYLAWRTLEGLEVSEPYDKAKLGHDHFANHSEGTVA